MLAIQIYDISYPTKCTGFDSEDQGHNLLFTKYILRHYLIWFSPQFSVIINASKEIKAQKLSLCQALGKAVGIQTGEALSIRGPLKSWMDHISPIDRCSIRLLLSKEAFKKLPSSYKLFGGKSKISLAIST